jgi:O-antigen biosynthesis protein
MHQSSLDKMKSFSEKYLYSFRSKNLRILDLGSQNIGGSYRNIFSNPNWQYVGADLIEGDNVDLVLKDPYKWSEIDSSEFDVVISGQAFEHIEFFWLTIGEISRILKPGGFCCIIAPSSGHEHRYPVDCWRFYPDGFSALARYGNLDVIESTTSWNEDNYTDGSNEWKDTILIAQKPFQVGKNNAATDLKEISIVPSSFFQNLDIVKDYPAVNTEDLSLNSIDPNSSLSKILNLIPAVSSGHALDVGCSTGYLAKLLNQKGYKVSGIEINEDSAKKAEQFCSRVVISDLDKVLISSLFETSTFDLIVYGDVLEHLKNPWLVLQESRKLLNENGYIIASIPNIAHGAIRLSLLKGQFNYSNYGLLDNSHIRFFTKDSVISLFEQSGYKIEELDRTIYPIFSDPDSLVVPYICSRSFSQELIQFIEDSEESNTLQFIVKAYPESLQGWCNYLNQKLIKSSVNLSSIKSQLEQTQSQLEQTQSQLEQTQSQLEQTYGTIQAMQSSKFWLIKKVYLKIKSVLTFH